VRINVLFSREPHVHLSKGTGSGAAPAFARFVLLSHALFALFTERKRPHVKRLTLLRKGFRRGREGIQYSLGRVFQEGMS